MVAHSLKQSVCAVYFISRLSNWMHFNHEKHTDKIKDEVEKNGFRELTLKLLFFLSFVYLFFILMHHTLSPISTAKWL